ncbi:MAG: hypothetical protein COT92_02885 [Candidatus Doudnabacteria bacterium CG10_big_fil_rev_8_21_14_0_10_42_18]|uniref:Peptidase S8/S53 domain-containing protein n=1 Tax=Candidatus Doudnabacteria bacterium CG10_big_fil_rev_8_21_14_0_10_42_18 TaxID=1974552 RepID=A0A2H0VAK7_9BACT|nr:MAG: hypothetical protein COT92_02885 [Candidatus Doudnabacteria bacterium CG10_big_fil_rev_8_21_14_0_10_42_18]
MEKDKHLKLKIVSKILLIALAGLFVIPGNILAGYYERDNYIIQLKDKADLKVLEYYANSLEQKFGFSDSSEFSGIYKFSSEYPLNSLQVFLAGKFEYLEKIKRMAASRVVLNDPGFTENSLDIDKQWGLIKPEFNKAWDKTTGNVSTVIAVIDTGIDATHEDLQQATLVQGYDFINKQKINGRINSDDNGHGTLVAGILSATPNNGIGISGINWTISVMPIKALDKDGSGDSSVIAEAIVWATDNGADILNLSLGGAGFGHDSTLSKAISYAFNKDVVIVAAAGNDVAVTGGNLDSEPVFPICEDNNSNMIIGVAAVDYRDIKPEFSNYGKNCIDVAAPGKRILSTINHDPFSKAVSPNSYAYASGTSLAVPFVAGQAALIKALFPLATNTQIRDRIISTADPVDNLNLSQCGGGSCRGLLGSGRINAYKSLLYPMTAQSLFDGDLVRLEGGDQFYYITGGQKRLVSTFVYNQRFLEASVKTVTENELSGYQAGAYAAPLEGTLIKTNNDPTVYIILYGKKLPITYGVFIQRNLDFSDVETLSFSEVNSWVKGSLLPPMEGSLLRARTNRTVYWVVGETLHPINYNFYMEKGLNIFPVLYVPETDLENYPKGEAYIR